jgi:hypothetical protein
MIYVPTDLKDSGCLSYVNVARGKFSAGSLEHLHPFEALRPKSGAI